MHKPVPQRSGTCNGQSLDPGASIEITQAGNIHAPLVNRNRYE